MASAEETEYEQKYTERRTPARPSMVTMTAKLLNVTEGVAAMNVKIAIGVCLCVLLLIATFVVNILAFEYAKDNKVSDGKFDKDTGKVLRVEKVDSPAPALEPDLNKDYLKAVTKIELPFESGASISLQFTDHAVLICPTSVAEELRLKYCNEDGLVYLAFASNGMVVFFKQEEENVSPNIFHPNDQTLVDEALALTIANEYEMAERRLLHVQWVCTTHYWQCNCVTQVVDEMSSAGALLASNAAGQVTTCQTCSAQTCTRNWSHPHPAPAPTPTVNPVNGANGLCGLPGMPACG